MERCCFCRADISSTTQKKKRRLLHRDACADARSRLASVLQRRRGKGVGEFEETGRSDALLCYQCVCDLERLETLQRSLQDLDNVISSRADCLVSRQSLQMPGSAKRSTSVPTSTPKRRRLAPLFSSPFVRRVQESAQIIEENPEHESPPCAVSCDGFNTYIGHSGHLRTICVVTLARRQRSYAVITSGSD